MISTRCDHFANSFGWSNALLISTANQTPFSWIQCLFTINCCQQCSYNVVSDGVCKQNEKESVKTHSWKTTCFEQGTLRKGPKYFDEICYQSNKLTESDGRVWFLIFIEIITRLLEFKIKMTNWPCGLSTLIHWSPGVLSEI